jgi:hypothetical protein
LRRFARSRIVVAVPEVLTAVGTLLGRRGQDTGVQDNTG